MWGAVWECGWYDQNTWKCHHEVPLQPRVCMFLCWPAVDAPLWHQCARTYGQGKFKSKIMIFPLFFLPPSCCLWCIYFVRWIQCFPRRLRCSRIGVSDLKGEANFLFMMLAVRMDKAWKASQSWHTHSWWELRLSLPQLVFVDLSINIWFELCFGFCGGCC